MKAFEDLGRRHGDQMVLADLGIKTFFDVPTFTATLSNPRAQSYAMGCQFTHKAILSVIQAEIDLALKSNQSLERPWNTLARLREIIRALEN